MFPHSKVEVDEVDVAELRLLFGRQAECDFGMLESLLVAFQVSVDGTQVEMRARLLGTVGRMLFQVEDLV